MQRREIIWLAFSYATLAAAPVLAAKAPTEWDGLVRVKAKNFANVYLAPGANFQGYTKVMIDPTEVAFHKDWAKDYNSTKKGVSGRISDSDVEKVVQEGTRAATDIFSDAFTKAGYMVVNAPGPDVLRVRTGVVNIHVSAPEKLEAGRTTTYSSEAGQASLVVEVRDSESGALMGRAVDRRFAGENSYMMRRNLVTNRADFRDLVKSWANMSARGLTTLKTQTPVALSGE
jgi:hypothetical protein